MIKYTPSDDVGDLDAWPFDNPLSNYHIKSGDPKASGRLDAGGPGHTTRMGIWRCTRGVFECTEQGDELMTILSGHCRLTEMSTGETTELSTGDSLFVRDGSRVTWDITEDVTKVFFGFKSGGF
ncbi:cupin domain-containing protein [Marivita sp. S0852]|uniref:cupin domain-containing protein n=1 Tax=Marivita sp. S0852 TaxID=3373893 RepID=UPI0039828310